MFMQKKKGKKKHKNKSKNSKLHVIQAEGSLAKNYRTEELSEGLKPACEVSCRWAPEMSWALGSSLQKYEHANTAHKTGDLREQVNVDNARSCPKLHIKDFKICSTWYKMLPRKHISKWYNQWMQREGRNWMQEKEETLYGLTFSMYF